MAVVNVINSKAQKVSQIDLEDAIFNIPVKGSILHEVVTMQLARRRSGSASVKHRSDVKGSGRKRAGLGIYYFEEDVSEEK